VALSAVAGIVLFHEEPNLQLIMGVVLTMVGMMLIERSTEAEEVAAAV